jgi:hypothetical protein
MKPNLSFPDTKISEAFFDFAQPLFETEGGPPTQEEMEKALQLASTVWNAVVFDTVQGNMKFVTMARALVADHPPLPAMIEHLILRKQTVFGHDLRLVGEYSLLGQDGDWRLRVEVRAPAAIE